MPKTEQWIQAAADHIANDSISAKETLDPAALWYRSIAKKALESFSREAGTPPERQSSLSQAQDTKFHK